METQYLLDDNNSVSKNDNIKAADVYFIWKLLAWCLGLAKRPKTTDVVGRDSKGELRTMQLFYVQCNRNWNKMNWTELN